MTHNSAYSDNHRSAISFLVLYSSHSLHDFVQNSYFYYNRKKFQAFFFVHPILMSIFLRGKSKLYKLHYCGIHLFSLLVIKAVEISALIKIKD